MQAPKKKTSKSRRDMRRAHHALSPTYSATCPNCQEPVRPHHVCGACGQYRGKQVLDVSAKQ